MLHGSKGIALLRDEDDSSDDDEEAEEEEQRGRSKGLRVAIRWI